MIEIEISRMFFISNKIEYELRKSDFGFGYIIDFSI